MKGFFGGRGKKAAGRQDTGSITSVFNAGFRNHSAVWLLLPEQSITSLGNNPLPEKKEEIRGFMKVF